MGGQATWMVRTSTNSESSAGSPTELREFSHKVLPVVRKCAKYICSKSLLSRRAVGILRDVADPPNTLEVRVLSP